MCCFTVVAVLRHGGHDDGDEYDAARPDTRSNLEPSPVCSNFEDCIDVIKLDLSYLRRIPSCIMVISFNAFHLQLVVVLKCFRGIRTITRAARAFALNAKSRN